MSFYNYKKSEIYNVNLFFYIFPSAFISFITVVYFHIFATLVVNSNHVNENALFNKNDKLQNMDDKIIYHKNKVVAFFLNL